MYYIIEHDILPEGNVNVSEVGRSTFALALSHYYDRQSKMVVNTVFTSVHLMLVDERLNVIKRDDVETQYQPVVEEPEETATEATEE